MSFYRRNSDADLRRLEREFQSSPTIELYRRLEAFRIRAGRPPLIPYHELMDAEMWDSAPAYRWPLRSPYSRITGPIIPQLCGALLHACLSVANDRDPGWMDEMSIWDTARLGPAPTWNAPEEGYRELTAQEESEFLSMLKTLSLYLLQYDFVTHELQEPILELHKLLRTFVYSTKHIRHYEKDFTWGHLKELITSILFNFISHSWQGEGREATIFEGNARMREIIKNAHDVCLHNNVELFDYLESPLFQALISIKDTSYNWDISFHMLREETFGDMDTFPEEHRRVEGVLEDLTNHFDNLEVVHSDMHYYRIAITNMPIMVFQELFGNLQHQIDEGNLVEWVYIWRPTVG